MEIIEKGGAKGVNHKWVSSTNFGCELIVDSIFKEKSHEQQFVTC